MTFRASLLGTGAPSLAVLVFVGVGCGGQAGVAAGSPASCGAVTASADAGQAPPAPLVTPTTLASGENSPGSLALDAANVYWTVTAQSSPVSGGAVMKLPLAGGAPTTLVSGLSTPKGIAVQGANVYWVEGLEDGAVKTVPVNGGTPTMLAAEQWPIAIAADAESLYWTALGSTSTFGDGRVMKMPLAEGTPTTLVAALNSAPESIAINATGVYWADTDAKAIMRVPLAGGAATVLAGAQVAPTGVSADAANVYWTNDAGEVLKVPSGGGVVVTLASGRSLPLATAVDATNVYWSESGTIGGGNVASVSICGGTVTTLATAQIGLGTGFAVSSSKAYWTTQGGLLSAPK